VTTAGRNARVQEHFARLAVMGAAVYRSGRTGPIDQSKGRKMRGFIIGALIVAVGVLGYLYWQDQQNSVSIELEAPKIDVPSTN
jgi:hypothetical protein